MFALRKKVSSLSKCNWGCKEGLHDGTDGIGVGADKVNADGTIEGIAEGTSG
jgi:hypothetical protein